jgi:hypothetical protein
MEPEQLDGALRLAVGAALRLLARHPSVLRGGPALMPVRFRFGPPGEGWDILVPVAESGAAPRGTADGR